MARRATKWIVWTLAASLLILGAIVGGVLWFVNSEDALHWTISQLEAVAGGKLRLEGVRGTLLGTITAERATFKQPDLEVLAAGVRLEVDRGALRRARVLLTLVRIDAVEVTTRDSGKPPSPPETLLLPRPVEVRRFEIGRLTIKQGAEPLVLAGIAGSYESDRDRHRLWLERVQTQWGDVQADLALGTHSPFALQAKASVAGQALEKPLELVATVNGTLLAPRANLRAKSGVTQADSDLELAPFDPDWLRAARVEARSVDLKALIADAPQSDLRVIVQARGGANQRLGGTVEIVNAQPGPLSADRLPLVSLESRFAFEERILKLDALHASLGAAGKVEGDGQIEGPVTRLSLRAQALDLHAFHASLDRTRLAGALELDTGEKVQRLALDLGDARIKVKASLRREGDRVAIETLRAAGYGGEVSGTGALELSGKRAFNASIKARSFDPARFGSFPTAVLNGAADLRGTLSPNWHMQVRATITQSRFRGSPVEARANFEAAPNVVRAIDADIRVGDNRARATGSIGVQGQALEVAFDARNLAQIDPRAAGRVSGKAKIEGTTRRFGGTFEADGANLAFEGEGRLRKVRATGSVPLDARQRFAVDIRASGVELTQAQLETAAIQVSGRLDAHDITGEAKGRSVDARFAASGAWNEKTGWRGRITRLVNAGEHQLELVGELPLEVAPGRVALGTATLRALGGEVALQSLVWDKGRLATAGKMRAFPVSRVLLLAGGRVEPGTTLTLNGEWSIEANPRLNGTARLERAAGDLVLGADPPVPASLSALGAEARIANDIVTVSGQLRSARFGEAQLQARIAPPPGAKPGVFSQAASLEGTLRADAQSLAFLQHWIGGVAVVDGKARGQLQLAGTIGAPAATGTLALDAVRIDAPQHGLSLRDGQARFALEERQIAVQSLTIRGGDGTFRASGTITRDERDATFEWRAEQLRLLNRPDRQLVASGAGTATLTGSKVVLRGDLKADRGSFVYEQSEGDRLGDDVVVVGRTAKPAAKGRRSPLLDFDVTLNAGEQLHVRSSGLDADLRGRLRVRSREDGEVVAHGGVELRNGSYRAFGQKLVIERGKLTFDGPVRNPALDLYALRKNQPVEAGVEVRGTLQTPVTRLVSEPPVSDQEKLSWLLLGRSAADAQGAESALLQAALASITRSKSGDGGIGPDIARRFGIDEVGLRGGTAGGQVVTLGKRIADRIYIDYEQGLTVAETLVRLKVQLTRTVNARIEAGSQRGRVGLGYDISYD